MSRYARWIGDLALGARLAFAGGRSGWARIGMTAVGVGLGVAMLAVAASIPTMLQHRHDRTGARDYSTMTGEPAARADDTLLIGTADTTFRDKSIRGRILQPDGPKAPLPPGVAAFPRPGEMVTSPALAELLSSPEGALLRPRLNHRVVGVIGRQGLEGPREYAFYLGGTGLERSDGELARIASFGQQDPGQGLNPVLLLLVIISFVVLLLPTAVFVGTAVRFGGESRDRRLAALRLVGADQHMARRFAAAEAMVAAGLGLAVGGCVFLIARGFAERITLWGVSFFAADIRPGLPLAALIVAAVPVSAIAVTLFSLRKVMIEPLGVVRRATTGRRRLWWRAAFPILGLALLYPLAGSVGRGGGGFNEYQVAGGVTVLLIGVATMLPWLVEAVVARLRGGGTSWQLAVRRLQLDNGTSVRAVSGVVVAAAGAIALQTMFGGVRGGFTEPTGQDAIRAQAQVLFPEEGSGVRAQEFTRRLRAVHNVQWVAGKVTTEATPVGPRGDSASSTLTIGDCPALRELIQIEHCADGDVYLAGAQSQDVPRPGTVVTIGSAQGPGGAGRPRWKIPGSARPAGPRTDPLGNAGTGVFATVGAVGDPVLRTTRAEMFLRVSGPQEDAYEQVRNVAATIDPMASVQILRGTREGAQFVTIRRGLFIGAVAALLMIGASLLVTVLEQLRERRQVLAVLIAFGTRRSTLNWSVLWQIAVPMVLGLALAIPAGAALGGLLLKIVKEPVRFDWPAIAGICGTAVGVVLLVTVLSMPTLQRLTRPEGLRTE